MTFGVYEGRPGEERFGGTAFIGRLQGEVEAYTSSSSGGLHPPGLVYFNWLAGRLQVGGVYLKVQRLDEVAVVRHASRDMLRESFIHRLRKGNGLSSHEGMEALYVYISFCTIIFLIQSPLSVMEWWRWRFIWWPRRSNWEAQPLPASSRKCQGPPGPRVLLGVKPTPGPRVGEGTPNPASAGSRSSLREHPSRNRSGGFHDVQHLQRGLHGPRETSVDWPKVADYPYL